MPPENQKTRTFGTTTRQLVALSEWLGERRVTHVAMESTGVYWKPIVNLLEDKFTAWVVNARHIKAVPGRKTDVKDAEWIADLLRHGLLKPSFIPERSQRELVRYRQSLIQERSREANRIQKVLEGANIKLGTVATDVLGVSGRMMLTALSEGENDPKVLADMAKGRLREKLDALEEALEGVMGSHQRLMLGTQLRHLSYLDMEVDRLDDEVARRVGPHQEVLDAVDTIPGVGRRTAESIVAEIGTDMDRFATSGHLASWAGVSPGNNRSAETSRRSPVKKGNASLQSALVEAARAASRTKTYLGAQYHRLARRIGANRAAMAVAHSIVVIIYSIIRTKRPFVDLGHDYFEKRDKDAITRRAVRQLERLGHKVTLQAA
jgi:transposase